MYLDDDGLVALEVVDPVPSCRRHVLLVLAVLLGHATGSGHLVFIDVNIVVVVNVIIILVTLFTSSWSHSRRERRNSWESCWSRPANSDLYLPTRDLKSDAEIDLNCDAQRVFST